MALLLVITVLTMCHSLAWATPGQRFGRPTVLTS